MQFWVFHFGSARIPTTAKTKWNVEKIETERKNDQKNMNYS